MPSLALIITLVIGVVLVATVAWLVVSRRQLAAEVNRYATFQSEGRFLFMNRHLRTTYPVVEAGRTVHDMFESEQAEDFTGNDDWVRRTGDAFKCEEVARGADGVVRHWSTFKFPVEDDSGRCGVGGISIEVTDRKQADEQATRSGALLRRLIEVQEHEKQSLCHEFHDDLRMDHDAMEVRVEDFGRGFDAASPPRTGFGVVGMAERARLCGGSFRVESTPGQGTVVTARLAMRTT